MHNKRNSMDQWIENSEERSSLGKTPQGKIEFKAYYSGSHVHILVKDDGHGIDQQVVRARAIERNIIKEDDQLTEKEVLNLLFNAGFTTKSSASDLSGRGVGMDVVWRQITELYGEIELKSVKGKGTETLIRLPLTLSIIDGFMVKVGDTSLIIPLSSVEKIYELSSEKLEKTYHNIVDIEGEQIQFLHLRKDMNLGGKTDRLSYLITVFYDEHRIGLVVDKVIGECQAVLKPLGKYLLENDIFSGASIMGDGKVALVVDTNKLIKRYIN